MKIAIDPGHGMSNRLRGVYDPGACSGGASEADIVLQWALTLKWVFERNGINCWLTRDDDRDQTPVSSRDNCAASEGCTHFISLHCNAGNVLASGTEVYYRDVPDSRFANRVLNAALKAMRGKNRGLKSEGQSQHSKLAVLDFYGPACLLEIGFITNPTDRKKMLDRTTRIAFAEALVKELK